MKKRFLSLLCALALLLAAVPSAAALENESQRALDVLSTLNINVNFPADHAMKESIPRGEAAVLLLRFSGSDVSQPDTALSRAKAEGILTRTVPQEGSLTAGEFCAALLRLLGYKDAGDTDGAVYARRVGLTARDYEGDLTWGDAFQILRDALTFSYQDGPTAIQHLVDAGLCTRAAAEALGLFGQELTARQTADRHMAAVFCIRTYKTDREYQRGTPSGEASGFFITADGLAATNYHTIEGASYATATLVTGEVYPVESVVYYDKGEDIALLRISRTSTDKAAASSFAVLELSEEPDLRPGDTVYTLGNPLGLGLAVSSGIVSAVDRQVDSYSLPCVMNTADISQGSSGGALLNIYGRVVAVTSGAYTYGNNMYLAVPIAPVLEADWTAEGQTLAEVARAGRTKAA